MKTRTDGCTPGGGSVAVSLMEALESRQLMSSNLSWVGVDYGPDGPSVYLADAQLGDDLALTGTQTIARLDGISTNQALDVSSVAFNAGKSTWTRAGGFAPFVSQAGTEFRTTGQEYSLGVLRGIYDDGNGNAGETTRYLIERRNVFSALRNSGGYYAVRSIEISQSGIRFDQDFVKLKFTNGQPSAVWWSEDGLDKNAVTYPISSVTQDGVVKFGTNQALIFGRRIVGATSEEFALYFDGDASDGTIAMGTFFADLRGSLLDNVLPGAHGEAATYRGSILAQTDSARTFFGISDPAAKGVDVVMRLNPDRTYALYKATEYDAGGASPISSGTWQPKINDHYAQQPPDAWAEVVLASVQFQDSRGQKMRWQTSGAQNLVAAIFDDGVEVQRVAGQLVSKGGFVTQSNFRMAPQSVEIDSSGNLYLVAAGGSNPIDILFHRFDLGTLAAGKPVQSAILVHGGTYSFSDDMWFVIAIANDGDILSFDFWTLSLGRTDFSMRDLTTTVDSPLFGIKMASGMSLAVSEHGAGWQDAIIAGRTTGGDLVYISGNARQRVSETRVIRQENWTVANLTQELAKVGDSVPDVSGPVFAHDTSWGARNLLFLNQSGQIVTVWTTPAIDRWYVNNLSQIAGAVPLVGQLSTLTTSWRGIHIHGLDASGNLHSVWWAPALEGQWVDTNLTADLSGGALAVTDPDSKPATLATWLGATSDMHILAMDQAGHAQLYWWSFSTLAWKQIDITPAVDPSDRLVSLAGQTAAVAPGANLVYGRNSLGDLVRAYATGAEDAGWTFENVVRKFA